MQCKPSHQPRKVCVERVTLQDLARKRSASQCHVWQSCKRESSITVNPYSKCTKKVTASVRILCNFYMYENIMQMKCWPMYEKFCKCNVLDFQYLQTDGGFTMNTTSNWTRSLRVLANIRSQVSGENLVDMKSCLMLILLTQEGGLENLIVTSDLCSIVFHLLQPLYQ